MTVYGNPCLRFQLVVTSADPGQERHAGETIDSPTILYRLNVSLKISKESSEHPDIGEGNNRVTNGQLSFPKSQHQKNRADAVQRVSTLALDW